jgi:hypothetical protein
MRISQVSTGKAVTGDIISGKANEDMPKAVEMLTGAETACTVAPHRVAPVACVRPIDGVKPILKPK